MAAVVEVEGLCKRFTRSARGPGLAGLLRAAAAYASGGVAGLERLASREADARKLLTAMGRRP